MKTLERIDRVKRAWDFFIISMEVADFISQGRVRRAIENHAQNQPKQPAMIKVKSERRPLQ